MCGPKWKDIHIPDQRSGLSEPGQDCSSSTADSRRTLVNWSQRFQLVRGFVTAPHKIKSSPDSIIFIKPKEVKHLFHDMMEHSAQIIANIKPDRVSKRPYISCFSNSVTYEALYDTGADICCLNEKIFRQIPAGQ